MIFLLLFLLRIKMGIAHASVHMHAIKKSSSMAYTNICCEKCDSNSAVLCDAAFATVDPAS